MSIRAGDGVTGNGITPGDVELWGTPSATGTSSVELTVTDADGATATNTFQLKVSPLLQTSFLKNATLGVAYSEALRVIGGSTPYTAAQTGGMLAAGLALDGPHVGRHADREWLLQPGLHLHRFGRPNPELYELVQRERRRPGWDHDLHEQRSRFDDDGTIVFDTAQRLLRRVDRVVADRRNAAGRGQPCARGSLSGTPASPGQYTFVVRAEDGANAANYAVRQFTLNVTTISINGNSTLPTVNAGTAYTNTFTATGGSGH